MLEGQDGTLSSFSYLLLVFFYLQNTTPPILPCLQSPDLIGKNHPFLPLTVRLKLTAVPRCLTAMDEAIKSQQVSGFIGRPGESDPVVGGSQPGGGGAGGAGGKKGTRGRGRSGSTNNDDGTTVGVDSATLFSQEHSTHPHSLTPGQRLGFYQV